VDKVTPVKGKRKTPTAKQYAQAIIDANGVIKNAAAKLKVSRQAIYRAVDRYDEVRQAFEDARENGLDYAETKLMEQIGKGNMTAIIFYLKTQGKKRGFVERSETHTVAKVDVSSLSDEQLEALAKGESID